MIRCEFFKNLPDGTLHVGRGRNNATTKRRRPRIDSINSDRQIENVFIYSEVMAGPSRSRGGATIKFFLNSTLHPVSSCNLREED